jgi:predicted amidohydrolase YtcJ
MNSEQSLRADLLIRGARIHAMDDAQHGDEAIAMCGDRILELGSNDEPNALRGPATRALDGRGATIFPGFIDAHSHPGGINEANGAHASMEEHIKGSLAPGKLADLVMLAADPHDTSPDEIKDIEMLRTLVGGKTVYEA